MILRRVPSPGSSQNTKEHLMQPPILSKKQEQNVARITQALEAARRFYLNLESKVTIAEEMGISRFTVSRLLEEARASGLVRIEITPPTDIDFDLSHELVRRTNLRRAIVLPIPEPESQHRLLTDAAASYLVEAGNAADVLGLDVGRTTSMLLERLVDLPPCTIVQLAGISPSAYFERNPAETMRSIASLSKGQTYPIYAPLLLENPDLVQALSAQAGIAESVAQFDKLTRVLFSVGGWSSSTSGFYDIVGDTDQKRAAAEGAVAEALGHLLDAWGHVVCEDLSARCLTIGYQQLRAVNDRVVIGIGGRQQAVLACVRAGLATTLITDSATAAYILDHTTTDRR